MTRTVVWLMLSGVAACGALGGPGDELRMKHLGRAGGSAFAAAVDGATAYVAVGEELRVLALDANPGPREVGRVWLRGAGAGVEVVGGYVLVANAHVGLQVVDVSEPARPSIVAELPIARCTDIRAVGGLAYVRTALSLEIVDVSDAVHPALLGRWAASLGDYTYGGLDVVGRTAYVVSAVDVFGRLSIVDCSDPGAPILLGYVSISSARDVAVHGSFAFVGSLRGLYVVEVSQPAHPRIIGSYEQGNAWAHQVGVGTRGERAVLIRRNVGMELFDVSDAGHATRVGVMPVSDGAYSVAEASNRLFVCDGPGGFSLIDARDASQPRRQWTYEQTGSPTLFVERDGMIYAAERGALRVYDARDPAAARVVGRVECDRFPNGIELVGDFAYVTGWISGLVVFDISDPSTPRRVAVSPFSTASCVALRGELAFVGTRDGTTVFDVSVPDAPRELGKWREPADRLVVLGDRAYIAWSDGVKRYNIRNLFSPQVDGVFGPGGTIVGLRRCGPYLAVSTSWQALVDLRESAFQPSAELYYPARPPFGYGAYIFTTSADGLFGYSLREPAAPDVVGRMSTLSASYYAGSITPRDGVAYVANDALGLTIISVRRLGDMNCDGTLNPFDIGPFVQALSDPETYRASYPACDAALADVNDDGSANVFDISAFLGEMGWP